MQIKSKALFPRIVGMALFVGFAFIFLKIFTGGLPSETTINGELVEAGAKPMLALVIPAIFALAGLAMFIFAKDSTIELNKGAPSTVKTKRLLGPERFEQFNAEDVAYVELGSFRQISSGFNGRGNDNGMNARESQQSFLNLVLNNGPSISVASKNQRGNNVLTLVQKAPLSREGEQIAKFLGVEFRVNTNNAGDAIQHVMRGGIRNVMEGAVQPTSTVATAAHMTNPQPVSPTPQNVPPQPPGVSVLPGDKIPEA